MQQYNRVIKLSSDRTFGSCDICKESFSDELDEVANHYVQQHGFAFVHVGQETTNDQSGKPWQMTVIIVGK